MDVTELTRTDRYPVSARYDATWLLSLDMGPHPLWQLEDLLTDLHIPAGSRVLDLGCGKGATSVFLAQEYDVDVIAFDLWVDVEELRGYLEARGVANRVTPVHGDVRGLPFGDGEFDAIVSIDAFGYFGTDVGKRLPGMPRNAGRRTGDSAVRSTTSPHECKRVGATTGVAGRKRLGRTRTVPWCACSEPTSMIRSGSPSSAP